MFNNPQTQQAWRIAEEEIKAGIGGQYEIHRQARPIKSLVGRIFGWAVLILFFAWVVYFLVNVFSG